jgi:glycosyltransferase involved in cell wall biosynthesis
LDKTLERILLSIICATYNGEQKLPGLLEALRINLINSHFGCEAIFVVDGSNDNSIVMLENFAKENEGQKIKVLRNSSNLGISQSRNVGISAAKGEILAFLDDDCRPSTDWLNGLVEIWSHASPSTVGIGGFVIPSEINTFNQRFCAVTMPLRPYSLNIEKLNFYQRIKKYYEKADQDFSFVDYLVGANMSFRKTALREVGSFPADIRFGGDDSYICHSLRKKFGDESLAITQSLVMPHEFSKDFGDSLRRSYRYGSGAGKNFWRGAGELSFNPGPLLILAFFFTFLGAYAVSAAPTEYLKSSASLFLILVIFCYSLFVTRSFAPKELQFIEVPRFGLAFFLCELLNLLGFCSASLMAIKRVGNVS